MKKTFISLVCMFMAVATISAQNYKSERPAEKDRLFKSTAVENKIQEVTSKLTDPKLIWMFTNCFPNTLDTTVHFGKDKDGNYRTFVYTGDIHAMWLRDSGAQVYPYVQLANQDPHLKDMLQGVINCQFDLINKDRYANAFNDGPTGSEWDKDNTVMNPYIHERKWEIDSECYPIRLAYHYWKVTGDTTIFGKAWLGAIRNILKTFKEQQRKDSLGPYYFTRVTDRQYDTKSCDGYGNPVKPVGLIVSSFRPSDDATVFDFLIPSNFFAVSSLRKAAEILTKVNHNKELAKECTDLANEVSAALKKYAVVNHPKYGKIYAYEVDGFGNKLLMDDANVPSLLAMAYLGDVKINDPIYQNTRRFVWSKDNPYFFKGKAAEGIGGPHIGYDMIWPMSIMMKAFTSKNDKEIKWCIKTLRDTDAGTGFMHESFNKDNPNKFTRKWFAWANTLFGELIIKLVDEGKADLLNSISDNSSVVNKNISSNRKNTVVKEDSATNGNAVVEKIATKTENVAKNVSEKVFGVSDSTANKVGSVANKVVDKVGSVALTAVSDVKKAVVKADSAIKEKKVVEKVATKTENVAKKVSEKVFNATDSTTNKVGTVANKVVTSVGRAAEFVGSKVKQAVVKIDSSINGRNTNVEAEKDTLVSRVKTDSVLVKSDSSKTKTDSVANKPVKKKAVVKKPVVYHNTKGVKLYRK